MSHSERDAPRCMVVAALLFTFALGVPRPVSGYSVLTHEAIVDAEWDNTIVPVLLQRFPGATSEQLRQAHAYAYGGSVIQDMGFYPFGSRFFSHLTHYVRSGAFVEALFSEARNINDYAFAMGALSHYCADVEGHELAVNHAVPLLYPKLRARYGDPMTWEDNPEAHVVTEFGFDTVEVVEGNVAPPRFRKQIGFKVAKPALERAFKKTYGLDLRDQMFNEDLALAAYREVAGKAVHEMSEIAWAARPRHLEALAHSEQHKHLYHLSRECYAQWATRPPKLGAWDHVEGFLYKLVPKIGFLRAAEFRVPTEQTERLFADSLKRTVERYEAEVRVIRDGDVDPPDLNLDTGKPIQAGDYAYCDGAYATLAEKLARHHFAGVTPELRENLLKFYSEESANIVKEQQPERWKKVMLDVDELRGAS